MSSSNLHSGRILQRSAPTTATNHIQKNQHSTPYAVTHGLFSPEDGHNDAPKHVEKEVNNKHLIVATCWIFFLSIHTNILVTEHTYAIYSITCTLILFLIVYREPLPSAHFHENFPYAFNKYIKKAMFSMWRILCLRMNEQLLNDEVGNTVIEYKFFGRKIWEDKTIY